MATTRPATAGQRRAPTDRHRGLRPDRPRPPLEPRHHPIPAPLARALFPRSRVSLRSPSAPERRAPPARAALAASSHTGRRKPSPPRPTRFLRSPHPPPSPRQILSPRRRLLHLSPRAPTRHRHSRRRLAVESPLSGQSRAGGHPAPAPRRPRASDARDNAAARPLPHRPEPRRRATPSRCAVRFAASTPPVCASPHDKTYGEEFPVGGNTSRCLVGSKSGLTAAGAAPPSSLPARGSPPPKVEDGRGIFPDLTPYSANEGPTQKQSRTQWPEDEPVHPVPEDGVSLIKPSLFQGVAWGKASQPDKLTVA
ncbi:hypothetical protein U9M48_013879 [Paspalum notatum var. saurae]|uniref:Uncharacterized protein n=1 Tax=Paspalum notatum var. saurae TaxID=547442 RepID=A0AAQ3WK51_PASNO